MARGPVPTVSHGSSVHSPVSLGTTGSGPEGLPGLEGLSGQDVVRVPAATDHLVSDVDDGDARTLVGDVDDGIATRVVGDNDTATLVDVDTSGDKDQLSVEDKQDGQSDVTAQQLQSSASATPQAATATAESASTPKPETTTGPRPATAPETSTVTTAATQNPGAQLESGIAPKTETPGMVDARPTSDGTPHPQTTAPNIENTPKTETRTETEIAVQDPSATKLDMDRDSGLRPAQESADQVRRESELPRPMVPAGAGVSPESDNRTEVDVAWADDETLYDGSDTDTTFEHDQDTTVPGDKQAGVTVQQAPHQASQQAVTTQAPKQTNTTSDPDDEAETKTLAEVPVSKGVDSKLGLDKLDAVLRDKLGDLLEQRPTTEMVFDVPPIQVFPVMVEYDVNNKTVNNRTEDNATGTGAEPNPQTSPSPEQGPTAAQEYARHYREQFGMVSAPVDPATGSLTDTAQHPATATEFTQDDQDKPRNVGQGDVGPSMGQSPAKSSAGSMSVDDDMSDGRSTDDDMSTDDGPVTGRPAHWPRDVSDVEAWKEEMVRVESYSHALADQIAQAEEIVVAYHGPRRVLVDGDSGMDVYAGVVNMVADQLFMDEGQLNPDRNAVQLAVYLRGAFDHLYARHTTDGSHATPQQEVYPGIDDVEVTDYFTRAQVRARSLIGPDGFVVGLSYGNDPDFMEDTKFASKRDSGFTELRHRMYSGEEVRTLGPGVSLAMPSPGVTGEGTFLVVTHGDNARQAEVSVGPVDGLVDQPGEGSSARTELLVAGDVFARLVMASAEFQSFVDSGRFRSVTLVVCRSAKFTVDGTASAFYQEFNKRYPGIMVHASTGLVRTNIDDSGRRYLEIEEGRWVTYGGTSPGQAPVIHDVLDAMHDWSDKDADLRAYYAAQLPLYSVVDRAVSLSETLVRDFDSSGILNLLPAAEQVRASQGAGNADLVWVAALMQLRHTPGLPELGGVIIAETDPGSGQVVRRAVLPPPVARMLPVSGKSYQSNMGLTIVPVRWGEDIYQGVNHANEVRWFDARQVWHKRINDHVVSFVDNQPGAWEFLRATAAPGERTIDVHGRTDSVRVSVTGESLSVDPVTFAQIMLTLDLLSDGPARLFACDTGFEFVDGFAWAVRSKFPRFEVSAPQGRLGFGDVRAESGVDQPAVRVTGPGTWITVDSSGIRRSKPADAAVGGAVVGVPVQGRWWERPSTQVDQDLSRYHGVNIDMRVTDSTADPTTQIAQPSSLVAISDARRRVVLEEFRRAWIEAPQDSTDHEVHRAVQKAQTWVGRFQVVPESLGSRLREHAEDFSGLTPVDQDVIVVAHHSLMPSDDPHGTERLAWSLSVDKPAPPDGAWRPLTVAERAAYTAVAPGMADYVTRADMFALPVHDTDNWLYTLPRNADGTLSPATLHGGAGPTNGLSHVPGNGPAGA
ncbi:hypothetical protein ACFFUZ_24545, partial [Kibdelosporangium philippinense]